MRRSPFPRKISWFQCHLEIHRRWARFLIPHHACWYHHQHIRKLLQPLFTFFVCKTLRCLKCFSQTSQSTFFDQNRYYSDIGRPYFALHHKWRSKHAKHIVLKSRWTFSWDFSAACTLCWAYWQCSQLVGALRILEHF